MENKPLSKLQSEAEIKFDKRFNCNDDWDSSLFELTPVGYVNANKKVKQFLSDQIQKAVEETRKEYQEALVWCSGSEDFQLEGKARKGWEKICLPLLSIQSKEKLNDG